MIGVDKLRDLNLEGPSGAAQVDYVSAASSLVYHRNTIFVIADDELSLAVFPSEGTEPGYMTKILEGRLSADPDERKGEKADLESLSWLEPFAAHEHGALLALGSGSGPNRDKGALIPLEADGAPSEDNDMVELGPLYEHLESDLKELNIEGAAVRGTVFTLFQRGNSDHGPNARIDLDLESTLRSLSNREPLDPSSVAEISEYPLGQTHGIQLCFSDASPLDDGRVVFSASAEDSRDETEGEVPGSALGIMDVDGDVTMLEPIDQPIKLEGVAAYMQGDKVEVLMVVDADDPTHASPLLIAHL